MGTSCCKGKVLYDPDPNRGRINEARTGALKIPLSVNDLKNTICKIFIPDKKKVGTGFFMKIKQIIYLITCHHVISGDVINSIINIKISDKENKIHEQNIKLNERDYKFFVDLDITVVEIKDSDKIVDQLDFLDYDANYVKGYEQYKDLDIFILQYPNNVYTGSGKIKQLFDSINFSHDIDTEPGSSGSPIILPGTLKVIGIHQSSDDPKSPNYDPKNVNNYGMFIGEIFKYFLPHNEIDIIESKDKITNNYITGVLYISMEDISKRGVKIINSYEGYLHDLNIYEVKSKYKNEKEIRECIIQIDNITLTSFSYYYQFQKQGKYKIKYFFKNTLTNCNYMFYNCNSLIDLDLSHFNTKNVTNMSYMFASCTSLKNIDLTNINTQNVINMSNMFYYCTSLKNLDLSNIDIGKVQYMDHMFYYCYSLKELKLENFNTKNVINMSFMFFYCSSLTNLDLSFFDTKNVKNMINIFSNCSSLKKLDLSNFDTKNIKDMTGLFYNCSSLTEINLSKKFNTENVICMRCMFYNCSALVYLDLSNFNTENVINMKSMFFNCYSLDELNLSNFKTNNVNNMDYMFYNCYSLNKLNLSSFDIKNVKYMRGMLSQCSSLIKLDFDTKNINKEIIFWNCKGFKRNKKENKIIVKNKKNYLKKTKYKIFKNKDKKEINLKHKNEFNDKDEIQDKKEDKDDNQKYKEEKIPIIRRKD